MAYVALFAKTFIGFFAVIDPIGAIPVLMAMTERNSPPQQRAMVTRASITAFLVLAFFALTQMWLFQLFGITMGAFRIAGGIFLFAIAFEMLTAHSNGARHSDEEENEGIEKDDISITPLAIPLLAGPATITAVVLAFSQARHVSDVIAVSMALIAACVATWTVLRAAAPLSKWLGKTGTKVVSRMMGLILASMAVQFAAAGALELFPALGHIVK